jgi:hypothetical protein
MKASDGRRLKGGVTAGPTMDEEVIENCEVAACQFSGLRLHIVGGLCLAFSVPLRT